MNHLQSSELTQELKQEPRQQLRPCQLLEQCPSQGVQNALALVRKFARRSTPVLITGESGTGKELVARAIHDLSPRSNRPFVVANCANQSGQLIADEFFGHLRGAFTGAISDRQGLFERADQGTLFLDEVGELPLDLQPKILRVLQEKETLRLGGTYTKQTDFRLIIATNKDLTKMVSGREFREDLFYRLNVCQLHIPPLRERKDDILHLARHFIATFREETDAREMSDECQSLLLRHEWRGNVRELQNIIAQALALARGDSIQPKDLRFQPVQKDTNRLQILREHRDTEDTSECQEQIVEFLLEQSLRSKAFLVDMYAIKARVFLEAYKRFRNWKKVAENLGVHTRTVHQIVTKYKGDLVDSDP